MVSVATSTIRLQRSDLGKPVVQELLRATFEILAPGAVPWSERQAKPTTVAETAANGTLSAPADTITGQPG